VLTGVGFGRRPFCSKLRIHRTKRRNKKVLFTGQRGDMKCIRQFAFLATILVPSAGWAMEPGQFENLGIGNDSCGQWTQTRREVGYRWQAYMSWVQGFLTAYNVFTEGTHDVTRGVDSDGLAGWIDNYCQQHPLDNLAAAAQQLTTELISRGR
jgi:hypothetical protein